MEKVGEQRKYKEIQHLIPVLGAGYPPSVGLPAFKGNLQNVTREQNQQHRNPKTYREHTLRKDLEKTKTNCLHGFCGLASTYMCISSYQILCSKIK